MHHIYTYYIVRHWADWLSHTPLSQLLHRVSWIVPTSQSIHIVSLSVVFGSALTINLRLLGIGRSGRSVAALTRALVPWIYAGLALLLVTGAVQTATEPARQFVSPAFWWKMLLIVCVLLLTIYCSRAVRANPARWDGSARRPVRATLLALVSQGLWIGIMFFGGWTGFTT